MRSRRSKSPPQGLFNWSDVVKYLEQIGALNKKYDSDLDGVVDKSADANTVGGHAPGTSAGDVLVLNTAGQVPLSNLPPIPDSQLNFAFAWEKVAEISETGVASITFTGLSGNTDKLYKIIGFVNNPNTGDTNGIFTRYNAVASITGYAFISWLNDNGTVSTAVQHLSSTTGIAGCPNFYLHGGASGIFETIIYIGSSRYVTQLSKGYDKGYPRYSNCAGHWDRGVSLPDVTEITLFTASGVTCDYDVVLLKPKW